MSRIYHHSEKEQRRCFAILRRTHARADWQSDFSGPILNEDGRPYKAGVYVSTDRDGEQILKLYLRPLGLSKTPVTTILEVVRKPL